MISDLKEVFGKKICAIFCILLSMYVVVRFFRIAMFQSIEEYSKVTQMVIQPVEIRVTYLEFSMLVPVILSFLYANCRSAPIFAYWVASSFHLFSVVLILFQYDMRSYSLLLGSSSLFETIAVYFTLLVAVITPLIFRLRRKSFVFTEERPFPAEVSDKDSQS